MTLIKGGNGDGNLFGTVWTDWMYAYDGKDYLRGYAGDDYLFGGGDGASLYDGNVNDYLDSSSGNDTLSGGAGVDRIVAGSGHDVVWGGSGSDIIGASRYGTGHINAGSGNDIVDGALTGYSNDGSSGFDLISYNTLSEAFRVDLAQSTARYLNKDGPSDTIIRFENVMGTEYSDILKGNEVNNELYDSGGKGDDTTLDYDTGGEWQDVVQITGTTHSSFKDVLADASQKAGGAVLALHGGRITLHDTDLLSLTEEVFLFA